MKNIRVFYLKNFSFLEVKFSIYMYMIYLNRRVFVMQGLPKIALGLPKINARKSGTSNF